MPLPLITRALGLTASTAETLLVQLLVLSSAAVLG